MKPTWKEYTMAEWDRLCGVSPDLHPRDTGGFVFNDCDVCINPHVLGLDARGWRIAIFTAQTPSGLWTHARDISFPSGGWGALPWRLSINGESSEGKARLAELRAVAAWVELEADPKKVTCPIPQAREALRLISKKIAELEPKKVPTFTQLSLFD